MITVVHNSRLSPAGHLTGVLDRANVIADHVRAHQGERLPTSPKAVVILGGEMSAFDDARFPFLKHQKAWIRTVIESNTPVLGLCLGAQLIADAMGGTARAGDRPEADVIDLTFTAAGTAHAVLGPLRPPVVTVHSDTFDLPPEAILLAHSDRYPHAFALGPALGIQWHPEVQTPTVSSWARFDLRDVIVRAGTDPEGFVHRVVANEAHLAAEADGLFTRWLGTL